MSLKGKLTVGNIMVGGTGGGMTDEERAILDKVQNKFDGVEVAQTETETTISFYSEENKLKEITFENGTGGGGTVDPAKPTLTTSFIDGTVVGAKDMVTIPYVFTTENIGSATLFVNITCGTKSKELTFPIARIGAGSANIGILDKGVNTITVYAVDIMAKMSNILTFDVVCGALEITSTFDDKQDFRDYSAITIPVTVNALDSAELTMTVNIDGDIYTQTVIDGYNAFVFPAEKKTVGVHATTIVVSSAKFTSNTLTYNVIIANSEQILLSSKSTSVTVQDGVNFLLNYRISTFGANIFNAKYYRNNNLVLEQEVSLGENTYNANYQNFPEGNHTLRIDVSTLDGVMSSSLTFNITVIPNAFQRIKFVSAGMTSFFDMGSKSNDDLVKDVLESTVINGKGQKNKLTLHDYNYNTNGWIGGRLVSNGNAWAEIDMKPFETNVIDGFTFYMSFNASNMGDDENKVMSCIGADVPYGMWVDSASAYMKTESNQLKNYYSNDKDISVTFVVHRTSTYLDSWITDGLGNLIPNPNPVRLPNPMIQCYINGVLTEIAMLGDSGTGSNKIYESIEQNSTILINTDLLKQAFGVSKIKTICTYNRPLEHEEVLQNCMADINDLTEQKKMYDRNYVTINSDMPTLYLTDTSIGTWADTTKDNKQWLNVMYSSPNEDKFGASFEGVAQTAWQGTSSLAYPVKNIKIKLYNYQKDADGNNINTTNPATFTSKKVDLYTKRDNTGYPEQTFTVKVDYMDSSHCRNTGTARMVSDFLFAGNPNPAKVLDPLTRDSINGTPCQIYINGEWIGLGNINHDKSCFTTLGMTKIPKTVRWEVKANTDTSAGAFFKTWETGNKDQIYSAIKQDFEIVFDETAYLTNSGSYDVTKYYDELGIPHTGTVTGGYQDYAILSLARLINFVSETTDEATYRANASKYFNIDRACRYYLNVMLMGMVDNFAKNFILNMYADDVWWCSFYDMDSQLSLDNTGYQKFREDIEPSHPNVYNCATSKMWVKLNDFFKPELFNNFNTIRNNTYTYENICKYLITNQIDVIPEIAYNRDMYSKYVSQGRRYLHMLHGNNKDHILRWLYNRFLYVDSLFLQHNSPYTKQSITIRSCKPLNAPTGLPDGVQYIPKFEIETYTPQYVTICWRKNTYETKRIGFGEKVSFEFPMTNSQDNEIILYCAGNLKRIGDCTDKNPTSIDIGSAFKLVEFKCENSDVLLKADLSKNTYLRTVSFKDCVQLGNTTGGANVLDVSKCTNLRTVDIRNTMITSVLTNVDGGNLEEIYYPTGIQNIVVANQTNLKVVGIPYGTVDGKFLECTQLVNVNFTNCNQIQTIKYPYNTNDPITFDSLKYTQNLTIRNSLGLTSMKFTGFSKLKTLALADMLNLTSCGFDDMHTSTDVGTLSSVTLSNCPKLTNLTMNVTSATKYVKFAPDSKLNLGSATSIKSITSNTPLVGLKTILLSIGVNDLAFTNQFNQTQPSDLRNLWAGSTESSNNLEGYAGIDFTGLNIKNLDVTGALGITNTKNLYIAPTSYFKVHTGLNLSGATIDLSNYTGSCVGLFKNANLNNVTLIKSNDFTQTDFTSMFEGATLGNCDITPLTTRMVKATNFSNLFKNSTVTTLPIASVPNTVTNIDGLFNGCTNLTDISGMNFGSSIASATSWSPTNLTIADNVIIDNDAVKFMGCAKLTSVVNLTTTNKVVNYGSFFNGCLMLGYINFSKVDFTNATSISDMLRSVKPGCVVENLTLGSKITVLGMARWLYTSNMVINNIFIPTNVVAMNFGLTCYLNNNLASITGVTFSTNVTDITSMLEGASKITSDFDIPLHITNATNTFKGCTSMTSVTSNWNKAYANITPTNAYQGCTGITHIDGVNVIAYVGDSGLDYVPIAWGGAGFDKDYTCVIEINIPSDNYQFRPFYYYDMKTTNTPKINWGDGTPTETMIANGSQMTYHTYAKAGTYIVKGNWYYGSYSNPEGKVETTKILQVPKYDGKNTANGFYTLASAFQNMSSVTSINLSNYTASGDSYLEITFKGCTNLTEIIGIENACKPQTSRLSETFSGCSSLTTIDLTGADTSNVTRANGTFQGCTNLTNIIGLNSLDLKKCTSIGNFVQNTPKLAINIDTSNWNKTSTMDCPGAFNKCGATSITGLTGLQFSGNGSGVFMDMPTITSLDLSGIDTSALTHISEAWIGYVYGNTSLVTLNLDNFVIGNNVTSGIGSSWCGLSHFGRNQPKLTTLSMKNANCANANTVSGAFSGCTEITDADFTGTTFGNYGSANPINFLPSSSKLVNLKMYSNIKDSIKLNSNVLTVTSLMSVIDNLATVSTTKTLTIGATNLAKLTPAQIAIATNKNWTVV